MIFYDFLMKNIKLCWIFMDFFGYRKLKQKDVSQP